MGRFQIYLAGGMAGLSWERQTAWRNAVKDAVLDAADCGEQRVGRASMGVRFFSPPAYYNYEERHHDSEREVMEYELVQLGRSDLVIASYMKPDSIGTAMEVMFARDHGIPIVGLNEGRLALHPWLEECSLKMFDNIERMARYVAEYFVLPARGGEGGGAGWG